MNAARLKYLAAAAMAVDHIGWLLEPMAPLAGPEELLFYLFRYIGRLAFPIFAFFAAEGCRKTHSFPRYLLRLGIFGGATHVFIFLASGGSGGSVIATFFLACLGIYLCERLTAAGCSPVLAFLPGLGLALLAQVLGTDYGFLGAALVLCLYFCGENRRRQLLCLGGFLVLLYLGDPLAVWLSAEPGQAPALFPLYLPHALLMTLCACAALPLLARYDGTRGRGSKWFFYWFYPGHLAALFLIRAIIS